MGKFDGLGSGSSMVYGVPFSCLSSASASSFVNCAATASMAYFLIALERQYVVATGALWIMAGCPDLAPMASMVTMAPLRVECIEQAREASFVAFLEHFLSGADAPASTQARRTCIILQAEAGLSLQREFSIDGDMLPAAKFPPVSEDIQQCLWTQCLNTCENVVTGSAILQGEEGAQPFEVGTWQKASMSVKLSLSESIDRERS
ncbi:MAG: hypothetical protein R3F19_18680 [Verrucomicrobiales bacterium]